VLLWRGCLLGHEANSCWLGYFQVVVWNMLWLGFTQHHIAFLVGFSLFVIGCGGWLYWSILFPYWFCSISKDFYFASWYVGDVFWKEWMEIQGNFWFYYLFIHYFLFWVGVLGNMHCMSLKGFDISKVVSLTHLHFKSYAFDSFCSDELLVMDVCCGGNGGRLLFGMTVVSHWL